MSQVVGSVLDGKYELIRLLGEGGMGAVYEARHLLIGRRLAVKFLHVQYASNQEVITRFQREAQAASKIQHEHIIEVTDMGTAPDRTPYIVMEYLEGRDIKQLLEETGPLPPQRASHIMLQALSGLHAAHEVEIIHRDMKPENIYIISKSGNPDYVKLLDFGISKFRSLEGEGVKGLTQTGTVLGTPYYMSPEQARGDQNISNRSDIYAMGVILYQMLSGRLPFDAPNYNALLIKILTEEPPDLLEFNPDLPAEMVEVVRCAMSRDADQRFQSCVEFQQALRPFAPGSFGTMDQHLTMASRTAIQAALSKTQTPLETVQRGDEKPRANRKIAVAAAASVAVVGVVLAALFAAGAFVGKAPRPEPVPVAAPAQPVASVPTPAAVGSSAAPKQAPTETVHLRVMATPAEASIKIDGVIGKNPFDGPVIKDGTVHVMEIAARGFATQTAQVSFDRDQELSYALERGDTGRRVKGAAKPDGAKPSPEEIAAPPAAKSPDKGAAKGKPKRRIDDDDPW
ncbi:MAG: protein kinase [Deltaproteobacteria bacterium]|nr:protein kinase [Deltaproteobacteria bacterium]